MRRYPESFVSPTNLHCSQTEAQAFETEAMFVSPTNLHCSQTLCVRHIALTGFVSPTNLHCSQTYGTMVHNNYSLFPLRIYTALKQRLILRIVR